MQNQFKGVKNSYNNNIFLRKWLEYQFFALSLHKIQCNPICKSRCKFQCKFGYKISENKANSKEIWQKLAL